MMAVAEQSGTARSHERELVERILRLATIQADEIMVPRIDVVGVRDDSTLGQAYELARRSRHARLPVYRENLDGIWGIISIADLPRWRGTAAMDTALAEFREAVLTPPVPGEARVLPVYPSEHFPDTAKLDALLAAVRHSRTHLFILVGEYGGTSGILTLNDILDEVVGQLTPPDGRATRELVAAADGYLADGRMLLRDLAEETGIAVAANGVDTLSGYVMEQLGRLPRTGDRVTLADYEAEVLRMAGRRVGSLRLSPMAPRDGVGREEDR